MNHRDTEATEKRLSVQASLLAHISLGSLSVFSVPLWLVLFIRSAFGFLLFMQPSISLVFGLGSAVSASGAAEEESAGDDLHQDEGSGEVGPVNRPSDGTAKRRASEQPGREVE